MQILEDDQNINLLLEQLAKAGYLIQQLTPTAKTLCSWRLSKAASSESYLHTDGNRYWGIDLSGMLPLYQDIYQSIYIQRLENWGITDSDDVGLFYANGLILIWGPDEFMCAKRPAAVALQEIEAANELWVDWLEQWWHQAAVNWEDQLDCFWSNLCQGHTSVEGLQSIVEGKVKLNAIGVDSLMPSAKLVEEWLSPHIASPLLTDVVEGCYLPASGYLAYDVLEMECWKLAASFQSLGNLSNEAHVRFIQQGLFYLYNALNNDKKKYFFYQYPLETATKYSRAAPGTEAITVHMEEVRQRNWRRRYHHEWARQQIDAIITDSHARQRLLVLHRFLGTARDFDEEKRRLNMKLWRALFALADGLGLSLTQPQANLSYLCNAINLRHGQVVIDSVFTACTDRAR